MVVTVNQTLNNDKILGIFEFVMYVDVTEASWTLFKFEPSHLQAV